jgi:hypothetical protein
VGILAVRRHIIIIAAALLLAGCGASGAVFTVPASAGAAKCPVVGCYGSTKDILSITPRACVVL